MQTVRANRNAAENPLSACVWTQIVLAVAGVHRVMVELATATEKAGKAIAEGKTQLQKAVEKVKTFTIVLEFFSGGVGGPIM